MIIIALKLYQINNKCEFPYVEIAIFYLQKDPKISHSDFNINGLKSTL